MGVSGVGANEIEQFHGRFQQFGMSPANREMMPKPPGEKMDRAEMSKIGQFFSQVHTELSEDEQAEVKDFMDKVRESVMNGTFDAAALAEEAPESMKTIAEEQGINLEDLLNTLSQGPPRMKRGGPPANSEFGQLLNAVRTELGDEDREAVRAFFESARSEFESGSVDVESLVSQAPQSLIDLAEEQGLDLTEILNTLAARFTEGTSA